MPPAEYLKERLTKLTEDSATDQSWLDFADGWIAVLNLRSEMDSERGQAILDCMCLDEDVLIGLGAAEQLSHAVFEKPPLELLKLLKQGPGKHLKKHEYEYRRKIDEELSQIRRIMAGNASHCKGQCQSVGRDTPCDRDAWWREPNRVAAPCDV